jgi:predicted nuclease with TOPRIM domain
LVHDFTKKDSQTENPEISKFVQVGEEKEDIVQKLKEKLIGKEQIIQRITAQLAEKEYMTQQLTTELIEKEKMVYEITESRAWELVIALRKFYSWLLPSGSFQERSVRFLIRGSHNNK